MIILEDLIDAVNISLHPFYKSGEHLSVGDAYRFYYKAMVIPMLITIAAMELFLLIALPATLTPFLSVIGACLVIANFLILIPLQITIGAQFYEFVGNRVFHSFKNGYESSFAAVLYGQFPTVLLTWALLIPATSIIGGIVMGLWSFVVTVVAFSKQQQIGIPKSFVILTLPFLIIIVVFAVLLLAIVGVLSLPGGGF